MDAALEIQCLLALQLAANDKMEKQVNLSVTKIK